MPKVVAAGLGSYRKARGDGEPEAGEIGKFGSLAAEQFAPGSIRIRKRMDPGSRWLVGIVFAHEPVEPWQC